MLARLGFCICTLISIVGTVAVHATDIPALVQRAKPAVVEILSFEQQNDLLKSGTGFFISPDGILLTNYHVISGGSGIIAKTPTGAVYILKSVVSYSEAHDVAELQFLTTDAPYLTLGHSSGAVEGQRVLVIGNPVGLEGTVSEGIISAFRAGRTLIQITAAISPGSSGSPFPSSRIDGWWECPTVIKVGKITQQWTLSSFRSPVEYSNTFPLLGLHQWKTVDLLPGSHENCFMNIFDKAHQR